MLQASAVQTLSVRPSVGCRRPLCECCKLLLCRLRRVRVLQASVVQTSSYVSAASLCCADSVRPSLTLAQCWPMGPFLVGSVVYDICFLESVLACGLRTTADKHTFGDRVIQEIEQPTLADYGLPQIDGKNNCFALQVKPGGPRWWLNERCGAFFCCRDPKLLTEEFTCSSFGFPLWQGHRKL